uniref:NADH-ubiquinone oxidoreductase chain 4 n=1 Tax=Corynis lateralis TaxID=1983417 RepID=A0A1W6Q580_9HYME|nr:NADH dehydrogenase subunit 4 [Corynis lateralis]
MLKFFFYLMILIPFSLIMDFWLYQFFMFLGTFLFIFSGIFLFQWVNLSLFLGMDIMSFGLILLTFWICSLMMMASQLIYEKNLFIKYFNFIISLLMMFLFLTFSVTDLFLFYLFFEISIIPVLVLIFGWGFQLDRIQAGMYLLFYTLFASLPFMLAMIYFYKLNYSLSFFLLLSGIFSSLESEILFMFMILAFLVKLPMFFVHLWLPKAHVEAPISGSMILAGIMLKLGGYGLLRIMNIFIYLTVKLNFFLISLSLLGGIYISFICLFQIDLKSLIAYSSVVHMSMLLCGLLTLSNWGVCGSYLMMISHGFCSSGLFCLVNIIYERLGSRSLLINKGLINFMPNLTMWWFLLCSSNMAAPPSLNLLSEIMLINSIICWSMNSILFIMILFFFSAFYTLYLYTFTQHGEFFNFYSFSQVYVREYLLLMLHWIPLNFFILNSELFSLLI